jgi:hypothetical protein
MLKLASAYNIYGLSMLQRSRLDTVRSLIKTLFDKATHPINAVVRLAVSFGQVNLAMSVLEPKPRP